MAASATFALKVAVWFRRGRLFMVSPDSLGTACPLSGRNSTYRSVQISKTSSGLIIGRCGCPHWHAAELCRGASTGGNPSHVFHRAAVHSRDDEHQIQDGVHDRRENNARANRQRGGEGRGEQD